MCYSVPSPAPLTLAGYNLIYNLQCSQLQREGYRDGFFFSPQLLQRIALGGSYRLERLKMWKLRM